MMLDSLRPLVIVKKSSLANQWPRPSLSRLRWKWNTLRHYIPTLCLWLGLACVAVVMGMLIGAIFDSFVLSWLGRGY